MQEHTAESLVHGAVKLYSLPDIYFQLKEKIEDPSHSARDLGKVIAKDPALSARLLKVVNSAFFGFPARIDNIPRAITVVGVDDLHSLALATSVVDTFTDIPGDLVDMTDFWLRSVSCAVIARLLAKKAALLHHESLFVAGMLHDLGTFILYDRLPEQSRQILQSANNDRRLASALEREMLGFTAADVSGALLKSWGLPELLSEPVACQLHPEQAETYHLEAQLLHLAAWLSNFASESLSSEQILKEMPVPQIAVERFDALAIEQVLAAAEEDFAEIFEMFVPHQFAS